MHRQDMKDRPSIYIDNGASIIKFRETYSGQVSLYWIHVLASNNGFS